jgi:hypothetical protein
MTPTPTSSARVSYIKLQYSEVYRAGTLKEFTWNRYTVPKTRQISEKIREEVPWKENFPVII